MKTFDLFGATVSPSLEADTVLVDPDTGYPVLHDVVTSCNCKRDCAMPAYCHQMHRLVGVVAGPDDEALRERPVSELEAWTAKAVVLVIAVAASVAFLLVTVRG